MTAATFTIGFVPLLDCAIPVVAREKGFAERHGVALALKREESWAAIRDKVVHGLFDGAHMLAPLPLALAAAAGSDPAPVVVPMALGLGGNAITVTDRLFARMADADPDAAHGPRSASARALSRVIAEDRAAGRPPLTFASVFAASCHTYELRAWLVAGGIDPDRDVTLRVVPPPRMAESVEAGLIDGYCVGEPWNLAALAAGIGVTVATKADIWAGAPEKVLGVNAARAAADPEALAALVRAMADAARWADRAENHEELAGILARKDYIGISAATLQTGLAGSAVLRPGDALRPLPHRPVFHRHAATFPWRSHATWLLRQMARLGQIEPTADVHRLAETVYRPNLYRSALSGEDQPVPARDSKPEGVHATDYSVPALGGGLIPMAADAIMPGADRALALGAGTPV